MILDKSERPSVKEIISSPEMNDWKLIIEQEI